MDNRNTSSRYTAGLRHAHWVSAALVVLAYVAVVSHEYMQRGSPERLFAVEMHFMLGMIVLVITVPRVLRRLGYTAPPITPPPGRMTHLASNVAHVALYAFLVVQPLLGIVGRLAEGHGIGLPLTEMAIPSFFGEDKELAKKIMGLHYRLGTIFYFVIGLHVAAAAWHLLIRRDNTVQRMV